MCEFDRMLINLSKPCEPKIQAQYPFLSTIYLSFTTFALRVHGMDIEVKIQHGIGTYDNYGN